MAIQNRLSKSRSAIFMVITFIIGILILELGVRMVEMTRDFLFAQYRPDESSSPFVDYKNVRKVFEIKNIRGTDYYIRTQYHPFIAHDTRFPVHKDANTLRIFCVGGSAAMGWPHDLSLSYPAFLEKKLKLGLPSKKIEVINVAASTYASYRVKVVFDEIINYQPDLVLIYTGNNEFLEKILYHADNPLSSPWKHLAVVRTIHQALAYIQKRKQVIDIEHYQPTFLIDVALGNTSTLKISQQQFRQVVAHYQYNIQAMVEDAQEKDIPVMLLTVPVNVRDWHPHASVHQAHLNHAQLEQWQLLYRKGLLAFQKHDFIRARQNFVQALAIDDHYAELHYYLGKTYLEQANTQKAKEHLIRSLETDAYPFRALPEFNNILKDISLQLEVPLVDIQQALSKRSAYGMIGPDVLVDHVHPTVASNQIIADEILRTLIKTWPSHRAGTLALSDLQVALPEYAEATLPLMQNIFLIYRVLLQFDKMDDLYQKCLNLPPYEKNSYAYQQFIAEFDRYLKVVQPYKELLFAQKTGQLHDKFTNEEVLQIVNDYIEINKKSLTANMTAREFEQYLPVIGK